MYNSRFLFMTIISINSINLEPLYFGRKILPGTFQNIEVYCTVTAGSNGIINYSSTLQVVSIKKEPQYPQ